jgi:hypothetical protein
MENSEQIIADLKRNLEAMMELHRTAMQNIPSERSSETEKIMSDLSAIPKHIEGKDFTSINQLLSKYAYNNPK